MWPLSLLFSSDRQTSQSFSQALQELEFEVETCPEIFSAVEKITSRTFDVIVSDWNEGLEAAFLLKTSRELRSNQAAFTIAIASAETAAAAREAGADLVLSRPIVVDEIKYRLLSCDAFLAHMKTWLPKLRLSPPEDQASDNVDPAPLSVPERPPQVSPRSLRVRPSAPPLHRTQGVSPMGPAESIFEDDLLYRSRVQTTFQPHEPSFSSSASIRRERKSRVLPSLAIAVAFLSVGYVFSEPLRVQASTASVAQIYGRVLERTQAWLHRPGGDERPVSTVQVAEDEDPQSARPGRAVGHIRVTPVRDPFLTDVATPARARPQPLHVETQGASQQQPLAVAQVRIPESLNTPVQSAAMRNVATRGAPSLLAAIEPVALSEDLSRKFLLQRVLPSYPEQAVRARLQGPVVLQAWIGRDGNIQSLKLIRGSLLLGQAAYQAVKQWRYQPYLINGRAVEAQTFVTVDFKLP